MTYSPCATSLGRETGNTITFEQFYDGNSLTKTNKDAESDNNDSIMPPLLKIEEMDAMDSENELDHDLIYTEMLEKIHDGSQSHRSVNRR